MNTLERMDFKNKYGVSTAKISQGKVGETLNINGHMITVKDIESKRVAKDLISTKMILSENGEDFILDLTPHWERGPVGDIHMCREGVMNLIKGVYAQSEHDYEELYLKGEDALDLEQIQGETLKAFKMRRTSYYKKTMRECEELLGPVFVKYAKVKALWKITHDVDKIAKKIGENPTHTFNLIERLGLYQTETAQNETEDY